MGEKGGVQQPLHQRLSGFRVAATLTVVLAAAFFMTYGNATTIAPNWGNTTGGDLSEVGNLDGGGNAISISDDLTLQGNAITQTANLNSNDSLVIAADRFADGSGVLSLWAGGTKAVEGDNGGGVNILKSDLFLNARLYETQQASPATTSQSGSRTG